MWKCKHCGCEKFVRLEYLEVEAIYKEENGELIKIGQEIGHSYHIPNNSKFKCAECGEKFLEKNKK